MTRDERRPVRLRRRLAAAAPARTSRPRRRPASSTCPRWWPWPAPTGVPVATLELPTTAPSRASTTAPQLADAELEMRLRINEAHLRAGVTMVDPATAYIDATVVLAEDVTLEAGVILRGATRVGRDTRHPRRVAALRLGRRRALRRVGQRPRVRRGGGRRADRAVRPPSPRRHVEARRRAGQLRGGEGVDARRRAPSSTTSATSATPTWAPASTSAPAPSPPTTTAGASIAPSSAMARSSAPTPSSARP